MIQFKMDSIIILKIFVWINRILGITFGGLTIDNNSNLVINKWLQLYGYLVIVIAICFDIKFIFNVFKYTGDVYKEQIPNLPENTATFLLYLMYVSFLCHVTFRESAIIYLNVKSGQVIGYLMKNLKLHRQHSTNIQLCIIMMFWSVAIIILIIVVLMSIGALNLFGYFHAFLSLSMYFMNVHHCWLITFGTCIFSILYNDRLDKVIMKLKNLDRYETSSTISYKIDNNTETIKSIKTEYIEIRRDVTSIDSCLSFMIAFRILLSIFFLMVNVYDLSLISIEPGMKVFLKIGSFTTITSIVELFIMCFICGSLRSKSSSVNRVLDDLSQNVLSDNECNQWLVLKNVCNNSEFGFTIGGFANLEKTTLIPV